MDLTPEIGNSELVTGIFGEWPTFHDAQVKSLSFDLVGRSVPMCRATLLAHRMTDEVDSSGHFVLKDRTLVSIEFQDIRCKHVPEFDGALDLLSLTVAKNVPRGANREFTVTFTPAAGVVGVIYCNQIVVTGVERIDSTNPLSR